MRDELPKGFALSNPAISWPASMTPVFQQGTYASSEPVYLPADQANGLTVSIWTGSAEVFVGDPSESGHPAIATIGCGRVLVISGVSRSDIGSVQSASNFSYCTAAS